MITTWWLLSLAHQLGLVLGLGSATVKVVLLWRCRASSAFAPVYLQVVRPITRLLILGLALLTLSGIGWLLLGYPFTPLLVTKLVLVAALWVLGPVIDNVAEPRFAKLVPAAGEPVGDEFVRSRARYVGLELLGWLLFFAAMVIGTRL